MGVRRGGKLAFAPPGNWDYEAKISRKREISSLIRVSCVNPCSDSLFACITLTLVSCSDELPVHVICFFAYRSRMLNSGADCSAMAFIA